MKRLNDLEAMKIAVEMERRGVELYRRAGRIAKNEATRSMMSRLEEQETQHMITFQGIAERALANAEYEEYYTEEASAFMSAIAADIVFPGGLMRLAADDGLEEPRVVLEHAIESEKNSIMIYSEVIASSKNSEIRYWLEQIVAEERNHLVGLTNELERAIANS